MKRFWKKYSKPIVEALKEGARIVLIAVIPIVIAGLNTGSLDWRLVCTAGLIAVLKAVDKFIHKSGHKKGLTRF